MVIGALLNAWAIAELSRELLDRSDGKISIVEAGTRGRKCQDDRICSEVLQTMIEYEIENPLTPSVQKIMNLLLYSMLSNTEHGKRLIRIGYNDDVRYCSQLAVSNIVPQLSQSPEGLVKISSPLTA